jgi:hypothetical protein
VLVVFGTEDPLVPTKGVQQAVSAACAKGDRLEIMKLIGYAAPTNDQTIQDTLAWLQARFGGQRLGDVCVGAT